MTRKVHRKHLPNLGLVINHEDALLHAGSLSILAAKSKHQHLTEENFNSKEWDASADELTADDRVDMQRSTGESMEGHGRNFKAFWSNRLKNNQLSLARFSHLDRTQTGTRLDRLAEVRTRVVARGKALVANPQYPDEAIIRRMSRMLAGKLDGR